MSGILTPRNVAGGLVVYGTGVGAAMVFLGGGHPGGCSCRVCEEERRQAYDNGAKEYDDNMRFDEWMMGITSLRRELVGKARGTVLEVGALAAAAPPSDH